MSDAGFLLAALLTAIIGMACFALSIDTHWAQLLGKRERAIAHPLTLRVGGAALLAIAFFICTMADPVLMAVLVWTMLLTMAAFVVALAITVHARLSAVPRRDHRAE